MKEVVEKDVFIPFSNEQKGRFNYVDLYLNRAILRTSIYTAKSNRRIEEIDASREISRELSSIE